MNFNRFDLKRHLFRALGALLLAGAIGSVPTPALATPAAGTAIGNQASASYTDASNTPRTVTSNVVTAIVQQVASLTLAQSASRTVAVGSQVSYPVTLTNTGNGADTFNLSFTQSGAFAFSSVVFYADANGDGVADNATAITATTALAAGDVFRFVAVGTVPGSAVSGNANSLVVSAVSTFNGGVSANVTETTTVSEQGSRAHSGKYSAGAGA